MESQNNIGEVAQPESFITPLKKVTPLSRYLALALFVALPFVGAWVGYSFVPKDVEVLDTNKTVKQVTFEQSAVNNPDVESDDLGVQTLNENTGSTSIQTKNTNQALLISSIDDWLFSQMPDDNSVSVSELRRRGLSSDVVIPKSLVFATRTYHSASTRVNLVPDYNSDKKFEFTGQVTLEFNHMFEQWFAKFSPDESSKLLLPPPELTNKYLLTGETLVSDLCANVCKNDTYQTVTRKIMIQPAEVSVLIYGLETDVEQMNTIKVKEFKVLD
jgi:hypothetical protein